MKIFNVVTTLIVIALLCSIAAWPLVELVKEEQQTQAVYTQTLYGTNYIWTDSMAISVTSIDTLFPVRWEQVAIWANSASISFRVGAPDTTSWSSREWINAVAGQAFEFGPATPLKRLEVKTQSSTGALMMLGYKKEQQY